MNSLLELGKKGQAVWLDFIKRDFLTSGELATLIKEVGLKGVTSNPAIFEKAIGQGHEYDAAIKWFSVGSNASPNSVYEHLVIEDIQNAADLLRPVYDSLDKHDGYVSLEVSPLLANNTQITIDEARRLWKEVNRPNLMIKVPATDEGILAVKTLIEDGINVNVTLLFSKSYYQKTAMAYLEGLEARVAKGLPIDHIHSVASFFISRIDSNIDNELLNKNKTTRELLQGKVAIANAKITYQLFRNITQSNRWQALEVNGGNPQRLLWASTSTKNPAYKDVLYVEELIGPETVNTLPPATLEAFRDHGITRESLEENLAASYKVMQDLENLGINFESVCTTLLKEGVDLFADAFEKLIKTLEKKQKELTK